MDDLLVDLDQDMEGLQTTVIFLQKQLTTAQAENKRFRTLLESGEKRTETDNPPSTVAGAGEIIPPEGRDEPMDGPHDEEVDTEDGGISPLRLNVTVENGCATDDNDDIGVSSDLGNNATADNNGETDGRTDDIVHAEADSVNHEQQVYINAVNLIPDTTTYSFDADTNVTLKFKHSTNTINNINNNGCSNNSTTTTTPSKRTTRTKRATAAEPHRTAKMKRTEAAATIDSIA